MIVSVFLLTLAAASAQSPQASPGTAMDQSLERQRAAIRKQAASASAGASTADSWFTTQWSIAPIGELRSGARPVAFSKSEIPCDPLDEAQATTLIRDAGGPRAPAFLMIGCALLALVGSAWVDRYGGQVLARGDRLPGRLPATRA